MQGERVGNMICAVGESPLWCDRRQVWYWVDITACTIWSYDPASAVARSWQADQVVACIALDTQGDLIAGMQSGIFRLRLAETGSAIDAQLLAAPATSMEGRRFNDGRCDRQGRFWSGTMAVDMARASPSGQLYRLSAAQGLSPSVVSGLVVQNGLAWSPDGRTMYLSDSHPLRRMIWAYDYDTATGTPSGRRVFVDMNLHPGRPDGAAVDSEGGYWICANDAGLLHRFMPDGTLERSVEVPFRKPSMCSFGGSGLRQLLVTSIRTGAPANDTLAGSVLLLEPGVSGVPEVAFGSTV
jgi:sugar lactone lactonase YvrE